MLERAADPLPSLSFGAGEFSFATPFDNRVVKRQTLRKMTFALSFHLIRRLAAVHR